MKLIYVAGPLRPNSKFTAEHHIAQAKVAASMVRQLGGYPVTPHLNSGHLLLEGFDETVTMQGALELMYRSDAVMLIGNWQQSNGTLREIECAAHRGMSIFTEAEVKQSWAGFMAWLTNQYPMPKMANSQYWLAIVSSCRRANQSTPPVSSNIKG